MTQRWPDVLTEMLLASTPPAGVASAASGKPEADARDEVILSAALVELAAQGLERLSVDKVARRAGINRATVYRRFGDRDGLVSSLVMREGMRMAAGVANAAVDTETAVDGFVEGFVAAIRIAREHPVIDRLVRYEPDQLLAAGAANDGALLRLGSAVVAESLRQIAAAGAIATVDLELAAESIARLFAMLVVMPRAGQIDTGSDDAARAYAQTVLIPMITGSVQDPHPSTPTKE